MEDSNTNEIQLRGKGKRCGIFVEPKLWSLEMFLRVPAQLRVN